LHIQEEANATMARVGTTRLVPGLATIALILVSPTLRAENEPTVARGVQYLRGHAEGLEYGEMALAALGMLKADVPPGGPDNSLVRAAPSQEGHRPPRRNLGPRPP
jgi:hypothetical protein